MNRIKTSVMAAAVLAAAVGEALAIAPAWQWQWTYGSAAAEESIRCTIQTRDGGYISTGFRAASAGGARDILVIRTAPDGTVMWDRLYDGGRDEEGHSIVETADGGFAIAGDTTSSGAGFETFILKIGPGGGVGWGRTYPGNAGGPTPGNSRVIEMNNGDLVVAGRAGDVGMAGNQLPIMARLSAAGVPVFQFAYPDARYGLNTFGGFCDVVERPVGGANEIVPVGFTSPGAGAPRQTYLVDAAANGAPIFVNAYYTAGIDTYANSVAVAPGNQLALAGRVLPTAGGQNTFFLRLTPALTPMASWVYRDVLVSFSSLWSLVPFTGNDEFIIGGSVPQKAGSADLDLWLSRIGGMGVPFWARQYGGLGNDRGHSAGISGDGLTIAGEEHSVGGVPGNGYIVKTDGTGESGCQESRFDIVRTEFPPVLMQTASPVLALPTVTWQPQAIDPDLPARVLCSHCPADLNDDGLVDFADYLEFLNLYNAGDLAVDYNGDGMIDFADYLEFLNYYDHCS